MKIKNDKKLEEELTFHFKIDMRIWRTLFRGLKNFKNFHFNGLLLTKVYTAWVKKIQMSYVWWHRRLMQNLKANWLVLSKMLWRFWQIFTGWTKNSDFILEKKMLELNQNENSKQPDRPDALWKLKFTVKINE